MLISDSSQTSQKFAMPLLLLLLKGLFTDFTWGILGIVSSSEIPFTVFFIFPITLAATVDLMFQNGPPITVTAQLDRSVTQKNLQQWPKEKGSKPFCLAEYGSVDPSCKIDEQSL